MFLILFQYTPAGKPPSIAAGHKARRIARRYSGTRKCSKTDTFRQSKTLHKAKNRRYFQRISGFLLLS